MRLTCGWCGEGFVSEGSRGRTPRFCSPRCKKAEYRSRDPLPKSLTARTAWTRRVGKRPITVDGKAASSTDARTWSSFTAVRRSKAGDGFGVMLGDGLGCWDLDHCFDAEGRLEGWAAEILAGVEDPLWVERSMSGQGLHVFVEADEATGFRRGNVEFYSRGRFIATTLDRFVVS